MGNATYLETFWLPVSKPGEEHLTAKVKKVITKTLQILGLAVLASFGIWPAMAYLLYMAMTS